MGVSVLVFSRETTVRPPSVPREMDDAWLVIEQSFADISRTHCRAVAEVNLVPFLAFLDGSPNLTHFFIEPQRTRIDGIGSQEENLYYGPAGICRGRGRRYLTPDDLYAVRCRNPVAPGVMAVGKVQVNRHVRTGLRGAHEEGHVRRITGPQLLYADACATLISGDLPGQGNLKVEDARRPRIDYSSTEIAPFVAGQ